MTNCDNCPWEKTRKECKDDSLKTLSEICKERYGLDLDTSYFEEANNQTLVHLVDLFKETPNQSFIEKEKREFLNKIFHDIVSKIGNKNIQISNDHGYWIKNTKEKRELPLNLPIPYLLELYFRKGTK